MQTHRIEDEDIDIPAKAVRLASLAAKSPNASESYRAVARPVLVRLPETLLAELDTMASLVDKSRSATVVHLLEAGLEEVRNHMDADTLDSLNHGTFQRLVALSTGEGIGDREQVEG